MYYAQPLAGAYAAMDHALLSPKRAEAQGIARITRELISVFADANTLFVRRVEVLHENRRLWHAIMVSVADEDNDMPEALRAGFVSLGSFVDRATADLLRGAGDPRVLIEINRRIVAGLSTEEG